MGTTPLKVAQLAEEARDRVAVSRRKSLELA